MTFKKWHIPADTRHNSDTWGFRWSAWRIQIGMVVHRHTYLADSPDRWVFHPSFTYDRKAKK